MEPNLKSSNYYEVLGLDKQCETRDIKASYRRLAKKYHPDKSKDNDAKKKFIVISRAYEVLSNPEDRVKYDKDNSSKTNPLNSYSYADLSKDLEYWADVFSEAFRELKGEDVHVFCRVTLEELKQGCDKVITLKSSKLKVTIKPDTAPNSQLKAVGKGNHTEFSSEPGDLYIKLIAKPHQQFHLLPNGNLQLTKNISLLTLIQGGKLIIPTLLNKVKITLPELPSLEKEYELKNQGIAGSSLIIKLNLKLPNKLSKQEKYLIQELSKSNNFKKVKLDD